MNITRLSIERPTLLAVLFILIVIFGLGSYSLLNYELVPRFSPPVLTITTVYPGAVPKEVETAVSIPIEDAVSSVNNIDILTAISKENFSLVKLQMKTGTDVDKTLQEVSRKLSGIADQLPSSAKTPVLTRFDFDDLPVIRMGLFANMESDNLTRFFEAELLPELVRINGVADIRLLGARNKEIMVNLNPQRLDYYGISILQVLKALGSSNVNIPAGFLQDDKTRLSITQTGTFSSLEEIRGLEIRNDPRTGSIVSLADVAMVYESIGEAEVLSRINGKNAMGVDIKKQRDANSVELSSAIRSRINALENKHRDVGLKFEFAQDTSIFTLMAANAVMFDLSLAILLVSLVMLVFLHSLRNSMIVFVSIPTSIITTFIVMYLLGYSLNLLTLLGLSLAIGILVDDSIVVIENIYRHLEMGKNKKQASIEGRMEIGFTAVSITLIDVVVFFPIILASGMVADLLRQFAVVIVSSTLMSLFVSFTLVPFLTSRFSKAHATKGGRFSGFTASVERIIKYIVDELIIILKWSFRRPWTVGIISLLLLGSSIALIPLGFIGIEFTKAGDRSEFILELALRNDATLRESDQLAYRVEQILMGYDEVETVFTNVGTTSSGRIETNTAHLSEIYVKLVDKNQRNFKTSEFARHIKYRLMESLPGLDVRPIDINIIGLRNDDAVQLTLTDKERSTLRENSDLVIDVLDSIPGTIEVTTSVDKPRRQIVVAPDREKLSFYGVNLLQAGQTLRTAFNGNTDLSFDEFGASLPIRVILDEKSRISTRDIGHLTVLNSRGFVVPFMEFSTIADSIAPAGLERTNRIPSITIKSQVIGRPGGTVSRDLMGKLEVTTLEGSPGLIWGGSTKRTQEGLSTMTVALAISMILVYLILVALYDSFFYPFVVLFSIPMAIIGALIALAMSMQTLSIFSIMGLIMLLGLVGKNAILVVDFTKKLKGEGMDTETALLESIKLRFRPILMTNLTMIIGLLPIALASGAGSEWKNGLAWVLIGGLSSSMLLTLVVVPVVFHLLDRIRSQYIRAT